MEYTKEISFRKILPYKYFHNLEFPFQLLKFIILQSKCLLINGAFNY